MTDNVMVINSRLDYGCGDIPFPPLGTVGEIVSEIDEDGEYDVVFNDHPCPTVSDPSWITHKSMIVFIDPEKTEQHEDELCLTF